MKETKKDDATILITKDMVGRVKIAIESVDSDSDDYFYLDDFLRVVNNASEMYISIDHVKRIAWVFCIALNSRDECEVFGSGQYDCPLSHIRSEMPICPLWQG